MIIKEVKARAIKDSRGAETIEVSVNGCVASSPSGKSTGKYETPCYHESLKWNVSFLNKWSDKISIEKFSDLKKVEKALVKQVKLKDVKDFGANALFAFESAILKALAKQERKQLWQVVNSKAKRFPIPVGNAIGGGKHSEQFAQHPVFQEFLLIPKRTKFRDNVAIMQRVYASLGNLIKARQVNDEGAWQAAMNEEGAFKVLSEFKELVEIGSDIAASSFYEDNLYNYSTIERTRPAHIDHLVSLINNYGVFYVEDPVQEEDFEGFAELKKRCREAMIVGDDLTVTHLDRVQKAIKARSISAMIVKPNQNGSLLEVKEIVELCKEHGIKTVMSHRSGETKDNALADYAFAFQTDYLKCGIATPWREAKLERMIEIEQSLK